MYKYFFFRFLNKQINNNSSIEIKNKIKEIELDKNIKYEKYKKINYRSGNMKQIEIEI